MLWQSARVYSTWIRLMVTSLFDVGESAVVAPMSFSGARSTTDPLSLKTVGQGVAGVQGGGAVTLVMTSESSVELDAAVPPPRLAVSESMTRDTGAPPWRETSPQETAGASTAADPSSRKA